MNIYSYKLAQVQVIINCQYFIAQMCTWEETYACLFKRAVLDDSMCQNELTTVHIIFASANGTFINSITQI